MTTTKPQGEHAFIFYLERDLIRQLVNLPDTFVVRSVGWNEDRQAFVIIVDAPEENRYFVSKNDIYPINAPALTIVDGRLGRRIDVQFTEFDGWIGEEPEESTSEEQVTDDDDGGDIPSGS